MVIEIIQTAHTNGDEAFIKILFDGRQQFYVEEDKEDRSNNTLDRNFAACFMIKGMLEKVIAIRDTNEPIEFKLTIIE